MDEVPGYRPVNYPGHMKTIQASEFKAKCLAILDEVAATGEGITILKRGKPVAQLLPATFEIEGYPQPALKGTVEFLGDVVSPTLPPAAWETEGDGEP